MPSPEFTDLEFAVDDASGKEQIFRTFGEACGLAVGLLCTGQRSSPVYVDVLAWSEDAARLWRGDHGVDEYRDDPDASVFERIEIKAWSHGMIP